MKKKITMLFMALFLVIANGTSTLAHSTGVSNDDILENIPEGIDILEKKEINKTVGKLNSNEKFREASKWFRENGVKLDTKYVVGLYMERVTLENGESFDNVRHIAINAPAKGSSNQGVLVAILDDETGELLSLQADLFYNINENTFSYLQTYTIDKGFSNKVPKDELDSQVQLSNIFFDPCVHASVWLCLYHCGLWSLAHPAAGIVCGVVCGYTFAYACSA